MSKATPAFEDSLSNVVEDFLKNPSNKVEEKNALKFMMKNAFIDEFLEYADEDGVYNYIF